MFLWFPRKSEYEYIPPALLNESLDHKLERVVKLAKARLTISRTIICPVAAIVLWILKVGLGLAFGSVSDLQR